MFEEEKPVPRAGYRIGQKLDELSIQEIEKQIESLKAEIERLQDARDRKAADLDAASALFAKRTE